MKKDIELVKNIKLLYVEDNDDVRESTVGILEYYFNDITIAHDGEEGLELYEKSYLTSNSYFHIVISDIKMPKMDGIEMCKKIKEINPDQLLVMLTAHDNQEYLMEAIDIGIDKFVTKPIISADDFIIPLIDLSKKVMLDVELQKSNFLLKQKNRIIDQNVLMTVSDLNGKIVDISHAYLNFTGYAKEEVMGKNHSIFRNEGANPEIIKNLWATILADKEWTGKLKNNKYSGEEYWISSTISPLYDINHKKIGYTAIVEDITNTKRLESLSITDSLTEIHNRRYFDYSLKREFKSSTWRKEKFGLLIIDVDYFKDYNDFYGHVKGDKVLKMVAAEIKKYVNNSVEDVFRIGGEEFAVFISDATDKEVQRVALDIVTNIELLEIEHEKSAVSKFITISIGAVNIDGSKDVMSNEDLYNLADNNLYKAKETLELTTWLFEEIEESGFKQYEISNFGTYKSTHNLGYWEYKDYIGLGSGAVGKLGLQRFYPTTIVEEYINNPLDIRVEKLTLEDKRIEQIFLGLRSCVGIDADVLNEKEQKRAVILVDEKKLLLKNGTLYNHEYLLADEIALFLTS